MSLYDVTAEVEAALRAPIDKLEYITIVDLFLDNVTRHYSDSFVPVTVDDGTETIAYTPMGTRIIPPEKYTANQSLDDGSLQIVLDSSRITVDTDPVGELIDNDLGQRRIRLRSLLFRPGTNGTENLWLFNVREGVLNGVDDKIKIGDVSALSVKISSGSFAFNERLNLTFSHADQQDLHPGDTSMRHQAQLVGTDLPWAGEF